MRRPDLHRPTKRRRRLGDAERSTVTCEYSADNVATRRPAPRTMPASTSWHGFYSTTGAPRAGAEDGLSSYGEIARHGAVDAVLGTLAVWLWRLDGDDSPAGLGGNVIIRALASRRRLRTCVPASGVVRRLDVQDLGQRKPTGTARRPAWSSVNPATGRAIVWENGTPAASVRDGGVRRRHAAGVHHPTAPDPDPEMESPFLRRAGSR